MVENLPDYIQLKKLGGYILYIGIRMSCDSKALEKYISYDIYVYKRISPYIYERVAIRCGHSLALFKVKNIYLNVIKFEAISRQN